jgi:hypothetical protein
MATAQAAHLGLPPNHETNTMATPKEPLQQSFDIRCIRHNINKHNPDYQQKQYFAFC